MNQDITSELWAQLAKFTINHANEMIFWVNDAGHFLFINATALNLLGYSSEDIKKLKVSDILADYEDNDRQDLRNVIDTHGSHIARATLLLKNGSTVPVESINNSINIDGQVINCALARDIREDLKAESRHRIQRAILENENRQLKSTYHLSDQLNIIGTSRLLINLLERAKRFAPNDRPVLINGESGVGKESIAKFVHLNSPRFEKTMVTLNCATLTENDIISHLFGHVKGAYTGAVDNRIGLFTLANDSTLFLDEVGELSLNVQAMLLRVLQEGQFSSMGSNEVQHTNARIIAATNRDLEEMVRQKTFRRDLLYRLNVLCLVVPPLRDRSNDVRQLLDYKLSQLNQKYAMNVAKPSADEYAKLEQYNFPGNIRELFNLVERGYFSSIDGSLKLSEYLLADQYSEANSALPATMTLREHEAYYIRKVLAQCNWQVGGTGGAAEILGVNRTTLISKMKKLGIDNPG
ncbi:hypothetical protein CEQ90_17030 [Lewinellaceae bacterium SD302]|nr:hypothetical protein CEQ90_17030 [Lewinellaceae bacterium SD302]